MAHSLQMHCNTGTMKMVIVWISMPPKVGIDMGTMMSEPLPVEVRIGNSAMSVTEVVMAAGRTRRNPAKTTASLISAFVCGLRSRNVS